MWFLPLLLYISKYSHRDACWEMYCISQDRIAFQRRKSHNTDWLQWVVLIDERCRSTEYFICQLSMAYKSSQQYEEMLCIQTDRLLQDLPACLRSTSLRTSSTKLTTWRFAIPRLAGEKFSSNKTMLLNLSLDMQWACNPLGRAASCQSHLHFNCDEGDDCGYG